MHLCAVFLLQFEILRYLVCVVSHLMCVLILDDILGSVVCSESLFFVQNSVLPYWPSNQNGCSSAVAQMAAFISETWVWYHNKLILCVLNSCGEWPRCWCCIFNWNSKTQRKITLPPGSPSLPCAPRCWQTSRLQEICPLPCVIHFSLLLGDRLLLPAKTAFAPVAETRARLRIPYVPQKLRPRGGSAGRAMHNELHNCTVTLACTGLALQYWTCCGLFR